MNKLINVSELSRVLTGNPDNIRANKIPKKYKFMVDLLLAMMDTWEKLIKKE